MDALVRNGRAGRLRPVPPGCVPGPETALPALLGYGAAEMPPAGPLEALGLGRELRTDETAYIADFVTVLDGVLADPTAGRPREQEATLLRDFVNAALGGEGRLLPASRTYRNLLLLAADSAERCRTEPPHAVASLEVRGHGPEGPASARLEEVARRAERALAEHELNAVRVDLHENPVTGLWPWGGGRLPALAPASERVGARLVMVSGPGFPRGLALAAGCETADSGPGDGAAASAALAALDGGADAVIVVLDGPWEASLDGSPGRKVEEIERADGTVIGPLREGLEARGEHRLAVTVDVVAGCAQRRALPDAVPFALAGTGVPASRRAAEFSEAAAAASDLEVSVGAEFLAYVLGR